MQTRSRLSALILFVAFTLLLLFPDLAVQGVRDALTLSIQVLAPSLFPFFVCSDLFVRLGLCSRLSARLRRPAAVLLRLPPAAAGALLLGLVGGYPAGAQAVQQLYAHGELTRADADRAAAICNQAGPSFFFGFLGGSVFRSPRLGLLLFAAQLASVLLVCRITGKQLPPDAYPVSSPSPTPPFGATFCTSVITAGQNLLHVCMFVTVFGVAARYLLAVCGGMPGAVKAIILGGIELTNGCAALQNAPISLPFRLIIASGLVSFGGICVMEQSNVGGNYLLYRLLQAGLSASITFFLSLFV